LKAKNICQGCTAGNDPNAAKKVKFLKSINALPLIAQQERTSPPVLKTATISLARYLNVNIHIARHTLECAKADCTKDN